MTESSRWYRQPVAWLFLILLSVTVLACIGLIILAIKSDDGLVADDYYKRGNEIGMEIGRDKQAATLGLSAQLFVAEDGLSVRALLLPLPASPQAVVLRLAHPTRAGLDVVLTLQPEAGGMLVAKLEQPLHKQRWLVQLEAASVGTQASPWRLRHEAELGPGATLALKAQPAPAG